MKFPAADDFFLTQNIVNELTDAEASQSTDFLQVVKAFENTTYQSMYVIDYLKQGFDYVSDNRLFLCGRTPEEIVAMGYEFYIHHAPTKDQELLLKINEVGFKFYDGIPVADRKQYSITYDFHLITAEKRKILVNHKYTPIFLTDEGKIWKALCIFSLSNNTEAGNIQIQRQGSNIIHEYDEVGEVWKTREKVNLSSRETEIL